MSIGETVRRANQLQIPAPAVRLDGDDSTSDLASLSYTSRSLVVGSPARIEPFHTLEFPTSARNLSVWSDAVNLIDQRVSSTCRSDAHIKATTATTRA